MHSAGAEMKVGVNEGDAYCQLNPSVEMEWRERWRDRGTER